MIVACDKPSRGRYIQGCRCLACTAANNAYWHKREKDKAKEAWGVKEPYFMDAEPVRLHLLNLISQGYTKRGIATDYDINRAVIHNLLVSHHRTGKPIKRIKTETGKRILEIGTRVALVWYVKDRPVKVYDSLEAFCEDTGKSKNTAQFLCTPSARKKRSYLIRVNY